VEVIVRIPKSIRAHPGLYVGATILTLLLGCSFFLPLPYDPNMPQPEVGLSSPSLAHLFGTDNLGRDIFSRVIVAGTRDVPLSLAGTGLALIVGVPLGLLLSSKTRGAAIGMRILDALQTFPLLILSIAIVTLTGNHLANVIYAIALVNFPRFIRLVRAEALSLRETRFIEASITIGASTWRVVFRHLLPNTWGVIIAQCSLAAAQAIIIIASLNFIGVGVAPPDATWGSMLQSSITDALAGVWWPAAFPSLFIVLSVLSFNLISDSIDRTGR
jgi:peptide/nickel transport system permease protein